MSNVSDYLWLIPGLPLLASLVTALFGPRWLRGRSHVPCIAAALASFLLSIVVVLGLKELSVSHGKHSADLFNSCFTWFKAGQVDVEVTLRADSLAAIMLVTVTFIGSLIAIYSTGYMHGDPGYPRYFAIVSLFLFAMTLLILADNFILLYAGWEGVGVCSYLLIGFWFEKPSAARAARKAFLVTRVGDLGFFIGILLLWLTFDHTLDYQYVFLRSGSVDSSTLTLICLLLFCGAIGKSAQFPLHVWLPDAMEGPSPVSALIHAATMVTAGVYMVARCTPLFVAAPDAQLVVAVIGGFTALLAALIALTQNDLKRVLAYSTVSQLGYMFLALGCGLGESAGLGVFAAIFHLFTHAFFKALLFLAAGSVMHSMGNVIDMRRFGGLRHVLKYTHWVFLCGAAALAGVPLLSGFWSKDEILAAAWTATHGNGYSAIYMILFGLALLTACLTALYTFRAYFLTFWGAERIPHEAGHHAHESPPVMLLPMMVLAAGAVGVGIVVEPITHWFSDFLLGNTLMLRWVNVHESNPFIPLMSFVVVTLGIGAAWWIYVKQPGTAAKLAGRFQGLYQLSLNKFHIDELYEAFILRPLAGVTEFCRIFDAYVVDGIIDLVGQVPRLLGHVFRPIQNGLVQFYALAMMLGVTVFLAALVWRYAW